MFSIYIYITVLFERYAFYGVGFRLNEFIIFNDLPRRAAVTRFYRPLPPNAIMNDFAQKLNNLPEYILEVFPNRDHIFRYMIYGSCYFGYNGIMERLTVSRLAQHVEQNINICILLCP